MRRAPFVASLVCSVVANLAVLLRFSGVVREE